MNLPRTWQLAALVVAGVALLSRVFNAFAYLPLRGYDGAGHAVSIFALYEGRLPTPGSWDGFQPPLYYAVSAGVWRILPDAIPVHSALRLLSLAAGFGAVAITWRVLRDFVSKEDAAIVAALVLGVPAFALATSMVGNETTCALFTTAVLARLTRIPTQAEGSALLRHAGGTAILASLAAISKTTGFGAVGLGAATYFLHLRRRPLSALASAGLVALLPVAVAAPFFAETVREAGGSPLGLVTGAASSRAVQEAMAAQPPGERELRDYVFLPLATLNRPVFRGEGMVQSVPGLLYASVWSDAHAHFLIPVTEGILRAESVLAIAGLLPTLLCVFGAGLLLRRFDPRTLPLLAFAGLLLLAFFRVTWLVPSYSAVKASYLMPALLPAALCLATALDRLRGGWQIAARAALLAIALAGTALTTWGWWAR